MKKFITILIIILFVVSNVFTAYEVRKHCKPVIVEVHDTTFVKNPIKDTEYITEYIKVPIRVTDTIPGEPQLIVEHDTTYVIVPISSAYYQGVTATGSYECWVSGYKPSLDSIRVTGTHSVVYETKYQYPYFDIQPSASVLVTGSFASVGVGIDASWYKNHWIIQPGVGYGVQIPYGGKAVVGPYAQIRVGYSFK